jgi:hypothetical protein
MAKFADALDRSLETIKRPPPLPIGHYVMRVVKMPDPAEEMTGKDGTTYEKLTINVQTVSASDDVDPDELQAYGNVAGVPMRIDFIFNTEDDMKFEGSLNRLKEFMARCGVDVEESSTLGEKLAELPNTQFLGEVKHRLDPNDPNVVYNEVGRTTSL